MHQRIVKVPIFLKVPTEDMLSMKLALGVVQVHDFTIGDIHILHVADSSTHSKLAKCKLHLFLSLTDSMQLKRRF